MRRYCLILILVFIFQGCANFLSTTANSGIGYGMNKVEVIRVNERKGYEVVSQSENIVVIDGMQEQLRQPAIKEFYFENDRLIMVSEKIK